MFLLESKNVVLENQGEPKPNTTCRLVALDDSLRSLIMITPG